MVEDEEISSVSLPVAAPALPYSQIEQPDAIRVRTGTPEFDRVLGGGIVAGSLVLLGGEPGIGKSTLLLQIAEGLSEQRQKVLYVAGEESVQQIKLRGQRLGIRGAHLFLSSETWLFICRIYIYNSGI